MVEARKNIDKKSYARFHARIRRKYGKAHRCDNPCCSYPSPKRYEWALIYGREYSSNIDDYMQLCVSCHRQYDFTEEQRARMRASSKPSRPYARGSNNRWSIPVNQFSLDGKLIKTWGSMNECVKGLGIHKPGLTLCLRGKTSQSKGFVFRYAKEPEWYMEHAASIEHKSKKPTT